MYMAGTTIRETFKNLENRGGSGEYSMAMDALKIQYKAKPNVTYQRHLFCKTIQSADETVAKFVIRLRKAAEGCSYKANLDVQIRDQVVENCQSNRLCRKLLEGEALTLKDALTMAVNFEAVEAQMSALGCVVI